MRASTRVLHKAWPLALLLLTACGDGGGGDGGTSSYRVGGAVSGLSGKVVLQNNGGDDLTVSANGPFLFPTTIADGGSYRVTVRAQPGGQSCSVSNAGGTAAGNVTNVAVACVSHWTWMGGTDQSSQNGVYGIQGEAAADNVPGARVNAVSWTDGGGKHWQFGGHGRDSTGTVGYLNDLWQFDGTNWTWVNGGTSANQPGVYGTKGVAAAANVPGARKSAVTWTDSSGTLWLFGGSGYAATAPAGLLNDLWQFDGQQWTWVGGSAVADQAGIYGTQGVAAAANIPGARGRAVTWMDRDGKLWLFGGWGYDSAGALGRLSDLWQFDGSVWTWVSGSKVVDQSGVYGTRGVAADANAPGARSLAVSWMDSSGTLWLFGGTGYDATGYWGALNDLWQFDGSQWTWVSGSNLADQPGAYGTRGVTAASNAPGARLSAVAWTDSSGNGWLFGGYGLDSAGNGGDLNDLWKFDGTQWTWVNGGNVVGQSAVYGTKGVAADGNALGARDSAVAWTDSRGKLWLFGGTGIGAHGVGGMFNDLWSYQP